MRFMLWVRKGPSIFVCVRLDEKDFSLEIYAQVNRANMVGGLIRTVDGSGDRNGIGIAVHGARFVEQGFIGQIQADRLCHEQPLFGTPAFQQAEEASASLAQKSNSN